MGTRSRSVKETGFLWVEEGEPHQGVIAEVAPLRPVYRTYSYSVPSSIEDAVSIGRHVEIPMGKRGRETTGFVVGLDKRTWDGTLRPIKSVVNEPCSLSPELVELGRNIAEHYASPLGLTLKAMMPTAVREGRGLRVVRYARLAQSLESIQSDGSRLTTQRKALLDALACQDDAVNVSVLLSAAGVSDAVLRGAIKQGWVEIEERKEFRETQEDPVDRIEPVFELSDEQASAIEHIRARIDSGQFSASLLFGVSGSGKTEVYVRAIRHALAQGKQAILLVPEIALTTQLVRRLAARFESVAVNHSGLTGVQRSRIWQQIEAGEKNVVIGTRSAVFAPCPNLGLICVDEEQEASYKNLQTPRFHVRDVAIMRAQKLGIPVVLGSATPSVEVWYRSEVHRDYDRITLPKRINGLPMPKVHLVDMKLETAELKRQVVLSRAMERLLGRTLDRDEQAIILMNRRGFASRSHCPACGLGVMCPNCQVGMVVHSTSNESICHYCRTRVPTPTHCNDPTCGAKLIRLGSGTQRIEEVLAELFPKARVRRVDSDTMKHRSHYESLVSDFESHEVDVLVGTQMIAKGLDFSNVSFVGVIGADALNLSSDFRAEERLFQLVTQVAGRAGRAGKAGEVVVQTTTPELRSLRCALTHDYESFVQEELKAREAVGFPPYGRLARLVLSHEREALVDSEASALAGRIQSMIASKGLAVDVLGPNACPLRRLQGKYRVDILLRTSHVSVLYKIMNHLSATHALRTKARSLVVDVDPVSLS